MFVNNKYSTAVGAPITCTTKPPIRILLWMDTCGHNNTATTVHLHINIVVRLHRYKLCISACLDALQSQRLTKNYIRNH